ncbi:MAG: AI-2E family transporter [Bacteroidia bacterium]
MKLPLSIKLTCWLLSAVLGAIILIYTKEFLLPVVIAALFALLLYPVYKRLIQWKVPEVLSVIITMLLVLIVILVSVFFISRQLTSVLTDISGLSGKISEKLNLLQAYITSNWHIEDSTFTSWMNNAKTKLISSSGDLLSGTISTTTGIFSTIALVIVYVFCFLLYNRDFRDFAFALMATEKQHQASHIISDIQKLVQRYLLGMLTVIFIIGSLNTIGLLIAGVNHALFFAFFAATLTVIPYIGIFIGASLPILYTLITHDSAWPAVAVVGVFATVQLLESNFITPKIVGSRVSINPFVAIVVLLIGGQLWGAAGMVLSIPLTAIIKVLFDSRPSTQAFGYFLGSEFTDKNSNPINIFGPRKTTLKKKD